MSVLESADIGARAARCVEPDHLGCDRFVGRTRGMNAFGNDDRLRQRVEAGADQFLSTGVAHRKRRQQQHVIVVCVYQRPRAGVVETKSAVSGTGVFELPVIEHLNDPAYRDRIAVQVVGLAPNFELNGGTDASISAGGNRSWIAQGMEQTSHPEALCRREYVGRVARAATADVVTDVEQDDRVSF